MSINPETVYTKVSQLCSLMALTLIVALGCFAEARAQWTTPDAAQNINNTNTGNVGKALEPLAAGTGQILALLSLQ